MSVLTPVLDKDRQTYTGLTYTHTDRHTPGRDNQRHTEMPTDRHTPDRQT